MGRALCRCGSCARIACVIVCVIASVPRVGTLSAPPACVFFRGGISALALVGRLVGDGGALPLPLAGPPVFGPFMLRSWAQIALGAVVSA